jgi:biopolymer transport protein ExbD/biopolymer transport protein TolR
MKYLLEVCLILLSLATTAVVAQNPTIPMQRGISVQLPATTNAVAVPNADKEDALVVAVTRDGRVYLGTDLISPAELADKVKSEVATRADKRLYVKADARTPYANVVKVLDAVRTSGVQGLTLLTDQREPSEAGKLVTPKGLEMLVIPAGVQAH